MIAEILAAAMLSAPGCYPPPVAAPIAVPYVQPACPYCAGHRGVEYALPAGTRVAAVAAGTVTFSGAVAGTRYVVVLQADGRRATYGMLAATTLTRGDVVVAGQQVGASGARLYFGLRDATDAPVDPTPLLGRLVGVPRLVPAGGATPRRAPPPRLQCGASVSASSTGATP